MIRLIVPVIICLCSPLRAETDQSCAMHGGRYECNRILICIGEERRLFDGLATGGRGPLNTVSGQLDNRVTCEGTRMLYNKLLSGEIALSCDDGTTIAVTYSTNRPQDGFGFGQSVDADGAVIRTWVGYDLQKTLRNQPDACIADWLQTANQ